MTFQLIDSHTHLTAPDFDSDRDQVIQRAVDCGVSLMVTVGAGYGLESASKAIALAESNPNVKATVGIHPCDAKVDFKEADQLKILAKNPHVVAIGETGLDFYRDWAPRESQEKWFRIQIEFALELKKPLIIHSREAGEECLRILKETNAKEVGGVFHCFAEDAEFAKRLLDINFLVSFPGTATFKKADNVRDVIKLIPLSQIMLETDAPYMSPVPHRGKRCESSFMLETAKVVADIKGISLEELAKQTTENAKRFYKL